MVNANVQNLCHLRQTGFPFYGYIFAGTRVLVHGKGNINSEKYLLMPVIVRHFPDGIYTFQDIMHQSIVPV